MELNKNRKERKEKNELKDSKIYTLAKTHTERETDRESRKKEERMDRAYCPLTPGIGLKLCGSHFPTRFLFDSLLFHSDIISMHSFIFIE